MPMEDPMGWLPAGWVIETKTRKGGVKSGTPYKCYIAPITGYKFYSKPEVFRYLKSSEVDSETPQLKRRLLDTPLVDNVISRIEKSPAELPPGWTKEIKFRKKSHGRGLRKDMYYTDPVTGCILRSKKDVIHYLETGDLGTHVHRQRKMRAKANMSTKTKLRSSVAAKRQKSPGNSVRRSLFQSHSLILKGSEARRVNGLTLKEQRDENINSSSLGNARDHSKTRKGKKVREKKFLSGDKNVLLNSLILDSNGNNQNESHLERHQIQSAELLGPADENMVSLEARNRDLSCNGSSPGLEDDSQVGRQMVLNPQNENQFDNMVLESAEQQQMENQMSGTVKQAVLNSVLPELVIKQVTRLNITGSMAEQPSKNEMSPYFGESHWIENDMLLGLQDKKLSKNNREIPEEAMPEGNQLQLKSEEMTMLDKSQVEEKCTARRLRFQSSKAKGKKVSLLPCRASKRLAGLEAEVSLDIACPEKDRLAAKHLVSSQTIRCTTTGSAASVLQPDPTCCKQVPLKLESTTILNESQLVKDCNARRASLHSSNAKRKKVSLLPCRASKRLTRIGAEVSPDITCLEVDQFAAKHLVSSSTVGSTISGSTAEVSYSLNKLSFNLHADPTNCTPLGAGGRLAGLDAEVTVDIACPEKDLFAPKHLVSIQTVGSGATGSTAKVTESLNKLNFNLQADPTCCTSLQTKGGEEHSEKFLMEKPLAEGKPASPIAKPFGDSWLDPCLEFAFRTLTSDIPEAIDTMAIEDYFKHQLGVGQTRTLSSNHSLQSGLLFHMGKDMPGQEVQGTPDKKDEC